MDLDIKNLPEEITKTVYLHWSTEYEWEHISEIPDLDNYVLISEPIEITFKIKSSEEAVNDAVSGLRDAIQTVRAKAEMDCNRLEEKIQSFLALPNMTEESNKG